MTDFAFLYRNAALPASPTEMQARLQRWRVWFNELERNGHLKAIGQPLDDTGRVVTSAAGAFTDGPYAETKDIVGGFSIIQAKDYDEAVALAKSNPLFEAGGIIEIRALKQM